MKRDQKFLDTYYIVIGALAAVAIAILVLAMKMSDRTQRAYERDTSEYQAAVADRIRPFGAIYLPGEEQTAVAPVVVAAGTAAPVAPATSGPQGDNVDTPEPVATATSGQDVYDSACQMCHGSGAAGAPIPGDTAAWTSRIAQGVDVLHDHAINGYMGSAGFMPPKGARADLSDDEVRAAVIYMTSDTP